MLARDTRDEIPACITNYTLYLAFQLLLYEYGRVGTGPRDQMGAPGAHNLLRGDLIEGTECVVCV